MNKKIFPLLLAQFLSAFADNAILFTVIAIVLHTANASSWYIPALQSSFILSFVIFAPWAGYLADHFAKSMVLIIANIIKAIGTGLLLMGVEPLLGYCVVGLGAALYSPAKYGILPELTSHEFLVKANSWIEGSTILAILSGMVIGAKVADYSTFLALSGTVALFLTSAVVTLFLPRVRRSVPEGDTGARLGGKLYVFARQIKQFFLTPLSRFAMLGGSLFWAAAATLRLIIVAWAPVVLMLKSASEIAELTLFLAIGIVAGSALVPGLIPLEHLRRAKYPAYLMALFIALLSLMDSLWPARLTLFIIGMMGGMFIVPINAALQDQGQKTIGSGSAVALQNFFQNLAMLLAVGSYTFAAAQNVDPVSALLGLGVLIFIASFLVSLRLPNQQLSG